MEKQKGPTSPKAAAVWTAGPLDSLTHSDIDAVHKDVWLGTKKIGSARTTLDQLFKLGQTIYWRREGRACQDESELKIATFHLKSAGVQGVQERILSRRGEKAN